MRQTINSALPYIIPLFALLIFVSEAFPDGAAGSGLAADTAVISVAEQSWEFSMSAGPGVLCRTKTMTGKGGITAMGNEIGPDGAPLNGGSRLEMNVYPEDWTPRGTQSHSIKIIGPGKDADWNTATPSTIKKYPGVTELTRAVVHSWSLDGGWASGTATFYLKDSLSNALTGGELVLSDGTFEIHCTE